VRHLRRFLPNGEEMEFSPRGLFALIAAGKRVEALSANTMWKCLSCYLCTSRCPQEVPITEVLYTLKRMSAEEGLAGETDAPAVARAFSEFVERYGRSFEFGLASRLHLTSPSANLARAGRLGVLLFARGRVARRPTRIREIEELQAIIRRAKKLGGAA
jgi:heterodisulfide reductase subunit C